MDIGISDLVLYAGKNELLYNAVLKLNKGNKYGLIGRNGVGKSTLLRAMSERDGRVPIAPHICMMHAEQEVTGDETSVLDSVLRFGHHIIQ